MTVPGVCHRFKFDDLKDFPIPSRSLLNEKDLPCIQKKQNKNQHQDQRTEQQQQRQCYEYIKSPLKKELITHVCSLFYDLLVQHMETFPHALNVLSAQAPAAWQTNSLIKQIGRDSPPVILRMLINRLQIHGFPNRPGFYVLPFQGEADRIFIKTCSFWIN